MKSWAVTRGPSLDPGDKRLAVHVEDHPVEYNDFEGTIPKGQYGGGTVMIWDRGTWIPEGDPHKGYEKGHSSFRLDGEKLHGGWHLVRMHGRKGETKEPWLLIKAQDEEARSGKAADILDEEPRSVVSGRTIAEIAEGKGKARVWHSNRSVKENVQAGATRGTAADQRRRAAQPAVTPGERAARQAQQAEPEQDGERSARRCPTSCRRRWRRCGRSRPAAPGWVHEVKFDGYRIQARLDHGKVRLLTRKGLDWTARFPSVARAVAALPADTALIDGEIVVEDGAAFRASPPCRRRSRRAAASASSIMCSISCISTAAISGRCRWSSARPSWRNSSAATATRPIRYSEHFRERRRARCWRTCLRHGARRHRLEARDAPYRSGRSDAFIKIKCSNAQELVVGGYAPSNVMPNAIGALVVGTYDRASCIMPGASAPATRRRSRATCGSGCIRSRSTSRRSTTFRAKSGARARWVKPTMVIEANLGGWTADDMVRQAAFKGVREDKPAQGGRARGTGHGERSKRRKQAATARRSARQDGGAARKAARTRNEAGGQIRGRARCASPIRTASTGRMSASPSRTSPTTTAWRGTGWRRRSWTGRSACCAARTAPRASASSRSTPPPG